MSKIETLWLVKDDPDRKWWCGCALGIANAHHHRLDTEPAGGTGYLFTCIKCRKAFMFARAARIKTTLEELAAADTPRARRVFDVNGNERRQVLLATPEEWLALARPMAENLIEGERYVFFDGSVLPARHGKVCFQGLWRDHDLPDLPHLANEDTLASAEYWGEPRSKNSLGG